MACTCTDDIYINWTEGKELAPFGSLEGIYLLSTAITLYEPIMTFSSPVTTLHGHTLIRFAPDTTHGIYD